MSTTENCRAVALDSLASESLWKRIDKSDLLRTLFVAACAIAVMCGWTLWWHTIPLLAVVALVMGCWPILTEAWRDARKRHMSMELSMLIAIVAAAAIGEWVTALLIATFVLAAEILEDLSMDRGRDALTDLMSFLPEEVQLRRHGNIVTVSLSDVYTDDVVIVGPGGRIPVDGVVVSGVSTVDQSRITGESLPVDIGPDSTVYAGSINQVGAVEVCAVRVGADSSYGRIVEAVRHAQESEPPVQRLADRLAAWLVYLAIGGALITYILTRDLSATISVIVVAGACGIAAGTPLAVLASIARIARSGAFVKDGAHLEALSTVDTIVFDKTGTLTVGEPTVVGTLVKSGYDETSLLTLAASAEAYSEHPLGQAIVRHARERKLPMHQVKDFGYRPGFGITATVAGTKIAVGTRSLVDDAPVAGTSRGVATAVHVAVDGRYVGTILLADKVRDTAREAVASLHAQGLRTLMITGDQEHTARAIAAELGIDDVRAGLLPHQKLAAIDEERAAGHRLAMVGDGVNDAPALARADVGIAMGSGTDIARESADIVLISSNLGDLGRTVHVAKRARRIVMFNFVGTIVVDLIGMGLAAVGVLGPIVAALIHVGSETAFILNSARLIPRRK